MTTSSALLQTWVSVSEHSDFPITNLPYGVFTLKNAHDAPSKEIGVAIGEEIVSLKKLSANGLLPFAKELSAQSLNPFMALGLSAWKEVRQKLTDLLCERTNESLVRTAMIAQKDCIMHFPFERADYVDFYASLDHASNVGKMFRPEQDPLLPNWKHIPVGYHGRAGTLIVSGTPITRPLGQKKGPKDLVPTYGPSAKLDIEAEIGFVVGVPTQLGDRISPDDFEKHVFGVTLVNDWSARDIQAWEYVPLGPFLGKSFATSVSPWIVPLLALQDARIPPPSHDTPILPYLHETRSWSLDLQMEVSLNGTKVSSPPYGTMWWSAAQQLAHMTSNGASLRTGDFFASGTVSGPKKEERGSFLELSWNGQEPFALQNGETRTFLLDGDTVSLRAHAKGMHNTRIGFGECFGQIMPAKHAH